MQQRPVGYSRLQIRLHWAVVALIAWQWLSGDWASHAFREGLRAGGLTLSPLVLAHFADGMLIVLAAFWRIMVRNERGVPAPPAEDPDWQKRAARTVHLLLYALLIVIPVAGALAWGSANRNVGDAHGAMFNVLVAVAGLHLAAAVYGQFVQKTGVLDRMRQPEG